MRVGRESLVLSLGALRDVSQGILLFCRGSNPTDSAHPSAHCAASPAGAEVELEKGVGEGV